MNIVHAITGEMPGMTHPLLTRPRILGVRQELQRAKNLASISAGSELEWKEENGELVARTATHEFRIAKVNLE